MATLDNLPTDRPELEELYAATVKEFEDTYTDVPTKEQLDELTRLADLVDQVRAAIAAIDESDERAREAAGLRDKITAQQEDVDEPTEESGEEEQDTPPEAEEEDDKEEEKVEENPEPVAASAKTRFTNAATGTTPTVPNPKCGFRLTTSARNYETGVVDSLRVAEEFNHLAHGGQARVLGANGISRTTVATVARDIPAEFSIGDEAEALAVLDRVTDETRLPGGSLLAAGGWCAPSETQYDFLPTETPADILSLPEVTVRRGGVRFPVEPDFAAVYEKIGFHQTEAQAQAGTEKTCFEVTCTDFEELRLDVQGVCITGGILQDKAWPELTKKFVDEALRLHAHKVNAFRINKLVEGSTDVGTVTGGVGTVGSVLPVLELQVADIRAKHRLPSTRAVEGMAPVWLLNIMRADYAMRQGVLPQQVTDSDLRAHFGTIGLNLQFVGDWQTDVIGTGGRNWPETVDVVLWTSGAWYAAMEPIISLGVIHDAAMLKVNKRIQMFTEDGVAVGKRGPESRKVTIPVVVNGQVGPRTTMQTSA